MTDVARRANVSVSTVSRVLSGKQTVAPKTRQRVMKAVEALGYQRNQLAQSLRLGRSQTVGFIVGDIEQTVYPLLSKYLQAELEETGSNLLLFNTSHRTDRLKSMLSHARQLRLSAVLIATSDELDTEILCRFRDDETEYSCPIVVLGQDLSAHGICSVWHDDEAGSYAATRHMIATGCKRIGYIGRIHGSAIGAMRSKGYMRAIREAFGEVEPDRIWDASYRYPAGYSTLLKSLEKGQRLDAVMAGSDEIALGVMAAAIDSGMIIPQDLSLVGFGDVEWGAHVRPSLSTLSSDFPRMARVVSEIIAKRHAGDMTPSAVPIPRKLILRRSVRQSALQAYLRDAGRIEQTAADNPAPSRYIEQEQDNAD
ncbi:LacI family transcriptional regulator [Hyphomicrobiales bacterium FT118]|uniref:LacI family transcriptional regulator n=1 Tax=Futiania mangrovi TaxID=2959716 RepID=A0A9J6PAM1_9PROT|nr:LacI family transcriptional regulator [Futiania mangrovii]